MAFKRVDTTRLAEQVTAQLKESILRGRYAPGERMPSEHELVKAFGVSRVIVREAVRDLERSGLVSIKRGPKGGAFVKEVSHDAATSVVRDILSMGKARVGHIMEVRLHVEPIVAGLAAERATKEDIAALEQYLLEPPRMGSDAYVAWNVRFHRLVARAAHNPMYEVLINMLMDFTEQLILSIKPKERVVHDTVSHPAILEMIKKKDAEGATRRFREHLQEILPLLLDLESKLSGNLLH
jgi:GntR family transcriptional repressor for pyruvate dehydrogenase complex